MSLLVDVMSNTLDEGYALRAAREEPRPRGVGRTTGILALVLLGLLTGTAVQSVRHRAEASAGLRAGLAAEVRERAAESDRLQAEAARLQAEVIAARDRALEADAHGRRLSERVRALELAAGTTPVTGPGLIVVLDDALPGEDPEVTGAEPAATGRVLDRDLQDVVNGLWAAGAEAVAVSDVRLSSRAAIRSAGEAVLVDFRPLSPPYEVEAIGDPRDLEIGFLDGPAGRRLQTLSDVTGIRYDAERTDGLSLPAATEPELRAVRVLEEPP